MFIPPKELTDHFANNRPATSPVRLKRMHLVISEEVAQSVFGDQQNVYVVYYPDRRCLMIAPVSNTIFKSIHKASQQMLKGRTLSGGKTIALYEILIDHQLDPTDRDLQYESPEGLEILSIYL